MRLGAFFLAGVLPCLAVGQSYTLARVAADKVNVRLGPGTEYPVLGALGRDVHAVVCGKVGRWYRVFLPRSFHVYVDARDLDVQGKVGVCKRKTTARLQPGRSQLSVGTIGKGTEVRLIRQYGVWWAVEPPLSLTGFMAEDYLVPVKGVGASEVEKLERRKILPLPPPPSAPPKKAQTPPGTAEKSGPKGGEAEVAAAKVASGRLGAKAISPAVSPAEPKSKTLRIAVRSASPRIRAVREAFVRGRKGPIGRWDLSEARKLCEQLVSDPKATAQERKFAQAVLEEIAFIGRVKSLLEPAVGNVRIPKAADEQKERKPLAVGWVRGQGKYVGRVGTHVLEKGGKTLFYLVGDGVDLDACINRLVAIERGKVEDLPPQYGTKLIRVQSVKVLTPNP